MTDPVLPPARRAAVRVTKTWEDPVPPPARIVAVRVTKMWETCQRTTFYVQLETDEGFTMTPAGHRTGSVYNDFAGLTIDEARDRALIDAETWGDFLRIEVEPYEEDGVVHQPSMPMHSYTMRRDLAKRRAAG